MTEISAASTHSLTAVLKYRDFRNLWIGLGLSSLGDWIGLLALTALANQQSGELAAVLGGADEYALANFAIAGVLLMRVLPALVMGPIAGWFADRLDRRTVLIWGDYVRAALFLSIPLVGSLWWVFVATVLIEMVSLVWGPAKDATVPNLVPRARLEAANQISLATTYGSALPAALLFTALTLSSQFYDYAFGWLAPDPVDFALLFNAVSFFVSGIVIARLRDIPRGPAGGETGESPLKVVVDGWKYVGGTPLVRGLVVGIIGAFAAGGVVIALARTFVADLGGGDPAYGVLFAAVFLGLGLGMWRGTRLLQGLSRRRLFGVALTTAGLLLFPLAALQSLEVVTAVTVLVGFAAGVAWITGNTMLGLEVPDEIRGRTFAFVGSMIRLALSVVLAMAPLVAGLIGAHSIQLPNTDRVLVYNGAAWTLLIAAVLMTVVGVISYRQMDDRSGVPLRTDLRRAFGGSPGLFSATGVFLALEGGEGGGKSTQAEWLCRWLEEEGYAVVLTRQPGGTEVGRRLREIVLSLETGDLSDRTETLLYAADKAEHVDTVIAPALARSEVVITDRYVDSTLAYQGAGRALPQAEIEKVARWATRDLRPHLTIVLDVDPAEGMSRFEGRDRIESESLEFHERVRQAFLHMAAAKPEHYVVIDARRPVEEVSEEIRRRVEPLLLQATRSGQVEASDDA
ncbi:dTMP kinase [Nocardioides massiliensis]|uniref:Thymidylate kinase n=3 Tax=Nocardioides massiliensis TaxID=1325935 RepID=A0ABT9NKI9_9ACTN|nr:dTMP kinase [Nocardioides massiliensis]MDP9820932.1 dTMP kinase [Nocardioides massiliensis]